DVLHCTYLHRPRSTLFPYTTLFRSQSLFQGSKWSDLHSAYGRDTRLLILISSCSFRVQPENLTQRHSPIKSSYLPLANTESLSIDRKSTRLNSSHVKISYAVFCLKK